MNRAEIEDAVARAACAQSSRKEEADPAIAACMALYDAIYIFAPDVYKKKPPTIAELEAILKNEDFVALDKTYDEAKLETETKLRLLTNGQMVLNDERRAALKIIEAIKRQSNRWKSRYEEKGVECGGLFDSLSDAREVITNQDAAITNKNKTISALEHALDVSRAALERMRVRSEDDERGKAVARSMELEAQLKESDDRHLTRDLAELDAGKVFGRLGLVAKEIAGISDNAPSMECIDAILARYKRVLKCADELHRMLRNRSVYPDHVINDMCDRSMVELFPEGWKP